MRALALHTHPSNPLRAVSERAWSPTTLSGEETSPKFQPGPALTQLHDQEQSLLRALTPSLDIWIFAHMDGFPLTLLFPRLSRPSSRVRRMLQSRSLRWTRSRSSTSQPRRFGVQLGADTRRVRRGRRWNVGMRRILNRSSRREEKRWEKISKRRK